MKRLLLTGAGGSIGCHVLIHFLHNTDWEIVCLDSFRHKGCTDRIRYMVDRYHPEYLSRVHVIRHDLCAPLSKVMMRDVGPLDYIVAMASLSDVQDSIENPLPFIANNVQVVLNTLEYARIVKPDSFLLISTDEVYGPTDGKSMHPEWSSIIPSNPYSASKASQEAIAVSYWRTYGVPLILANLMNNFGEMQSPAKFPAIVQRKVRFGEEVAIHAHNGVVGSRCYLHSRNCADALLFILNHVRPVMHMEGVLDRPERFNVVGDRQIDNLSLARLIAEIMGKPLHYRLVDSAVSRPGHDVHYGLDGEKLEVLGWKPPIPFEESLRQVVRWYEENPEWLST